MKVILATAATAIIACGLSTAAPLVAAEDSKPVHNEARDAFMSGSYGGSGYGAYGAMGLGYAGYGGMGMGYGYPGYGYSPLGMVGPRMFKRDIDDDLAGDSHVERRDAQFMPVYGYGGGYGYGYGYPMYGYGYPYAGAAAVGAYGSDSYGNSGHARSGTGVTKSKSFLKRDEDVTARDGEEIEARDPLWQHIRTYPNGASDYTNFALFGSYDRTDV